jgi:hypothetical protein
MKTLLRVGSGVTLAIALAGPVHAGSQVLVSPPISNDAGGISCVLTNAGTKPLTILKIETIGLTLNDNVLATDATIIAGDFFGRGDSETLGYCKFTINKAPKTVRAAACRFQSGATVGTNTDCVEAR